jgi:hypothetical protein
MFVVEDYVHRIGRTGRGGATGISHTFFTDFDKGLAGSTDFCLMLIYFRGSCWGLTRRESTSSSRNLSISTCHKEETKQGYSFYIVDLILWQLYGDFGPKTELAGLKATKITFDD